jgi:O-antigen chain-terminating methyltransferase
VIDLWSGRGEFLELAEWVDISAYGVDTDNGAVETCKLLGLDARLEDPLGHLASLSAESLGGVFCSQRIEYLTPEELSTLVQEVARVLKPGGVVIFETANPNCLASLASFWGDPARVRPVPASALATLMRTNGLQVTDVLYPVAEEPKLGPLEVDAGDAAVLAVVRQLNGLLEDVQKSLYGARDYTLVATK